MYECKVEFNRRMNKAKNQIPQWLKEELEQWFSEYEIRWKSFKNRNEDKRTRELAHDGAFYRLFFANRILSKFNRQGG